MVRVRQTDELIKYSIKLRIILKFLIMISVTWMVFCKDNIPCLENGARDPSFEEFMEAIKSGFGISHQPSWFPALAELLRQNMIEYTEAELMLEQEKKSLLTG